MVEPGGPANQAGIYYQNSIAALYLGRMLDLRSRPARHRVIHLRVEAPEDVDDILVGMGDGSRRFVQAKRTISTKSDTWSGLWTSFWLQAQSSNFSPDDRLALTIGESSDLAADLRACSERSVGADTDEEYCARLTAPQRRVLADIVRVLAVSACDFGCVRRLLGRLDIEVVIDTTIERDQAPLWMPEANVSPDRLLGLLRDLAGGASRIRGSFDPSSLRARLKEEHHIDLGEPSSWGAPRYRSIVSGKAIIEVPGTAVARRITDTFIWPRASRYDRSRRPDFDDETPRSTFGVRSDEIDLSAFPTRDLDRLVVIAGPGFGKSVLSLALAASAVQRGLLPAIVPIPELSRVDLDPMAFLDSVNRTFDVAIDWRAAAESGLLVLLFDGLDEVSSDRRTVMLERVKNFSVRYPGTPWLLTVRDAAALSAPTDALLVELEGLNDNDVRRFVALYRPEDPSLPDKLSRRLEARPELNRLARIPLFLAILLASGTGLDELPSSRTELLENYLELLLRPEQVKASEVDGLEPSILRPIAEAVAFEALERGEIGVSNRLLAAAIRSQQPSEARVQAVVERLVKCGVLSRVGATRYVFPFPIIQEYLAACHLLEHRLVEVPDRLPSAVKRPWAQVLQFVLEMHPAPTGLVDKLLAREDDAFSTNLRMLARCVANGTAVTSTSREEIARRLGTIWPKSSWRARKRVGELVADAFHTPLVPEIRRLLANRYLLHDGTGAVVARIADRGLTRSVLEELLDGDVEHLLNLAELQGPVSALGDEALRLYADRAKAEPCSDKEGNAMASLIGHLDRRFISKGACLSVALDEQLPISVRLAAFALGPAPIDVRALPLIDAAFALKGFQPRASAMEAALRTADPMGAIRSALTRTDLELSEKLDLVGYARRAMPDQQLADMFREIARDIELSEDLRTRLLVFAARYGDAAAMDDLVDRAGELPVEVVSATLSVFGHHRSRTLVEAFVQRLTIRSLRPSQRRDLLGSAVLGMTAVFEMDWFRGGTVKPAPPHPGLAVLRPLLETWAVSSDYSALEGLQVAHSLAEAGSPLAVPLVERRLELALQANALDLQASDQASTIGAALRALRDARRLLPLAMLETVVAKCSYNGASSAVEMIAAHGTREAFDCLLDAHGRVGDGHLKGVILDQLEPLAGRLGIRVKRSGGRLETAAT
jgi:hypothetical protein